MENLDVMVLRTLRDCVPPPPRPWPDGPWRRPGAAPPGDAARPGTLIGTSEHPVPADQFRPGDPLHDPATSSGPTRWGPPVHDTAQTVDGTAP